MNKNTERRSNTRDVLCSVAIVMITIAAFFCNYKYTISGPVQAMVWIGWLTITLCLSYLTTKGAQAYAFILESKVELQKVVWPTRQEAIQTTIIVMVMVAATGFILWFLDSAIMWAIGKITHLG
jgi:preprotein translocase subunit SecE